MPGHISKTVLSAGGCHSALEAHANICQATMQRMKAMPSCPLSLSLSFTVHPVSSDKFFCHHCDKSLHNISLMWHIYLHLAYKTFNKELNCSWRTKINNCFILRLSRLACFSIYKNGGGHGVSCSLSEWLSDTLAWWWCHCGKCTQFSSVKC